MHKFGLIGHPIGHSLSPALFKAGYHGKYQYDLIETPDFEKAYKKFLEEYDGINVTAPFKELAIRKADILSEECRLTGATNLLVKTPEGIKAYNSDFLGVQLWLKQIPRLTSFARNDRLPQSDRALEDRPTALVVGLGGAGKAAAAAAGSLGMKTVLMNRTQYSPGIKPLSRFREEFRKADIIIYNLPIRIDELGQLTEDDFCPGKPKHILEANYRDPSFDGALINRMKAANPDATYTEGLAWLLAQAVTGYEIFTGETPDEEAMRAVIKSK